MLYTNPRGSSGYGSAFGNAIKNSYPGKDYDDLMKGVDQVLGRGYIDEKNLFVYGGGVLTAWIVGHTDRFAAASSNYPVINDLRTPISQTEEFYMALKMRKVPTVMLRFNDEWHGTSSKPSNAMRSLLYMQSWFEKHARREVKEKSD